MNNDDHFIPQFYLKRWTVNGKLSVAKYIPHTNKIAWSELSTKGTGFEKGLYKEVEEKFFKPLDDSGSKVTQWFEKNQTDYIKKIDMGEGKHLSWAKYIIAQLIRIPDVFRDLTEKYIGMGVEESDSRELAVSLVENEGVIKDLQALTWVFAKIQCNYELITCDNPLIFKPNNLLHPRCVIILPMGPKAFFLATPQGNIKNITTDQRGIVSSINQEVLKNANERIYAKSKSSVPESFLYKHWQKT